ncbi:GRB2-associated-binding protein 2 [Bacillus rossius redtenbacheri]|uniref:GRB2-associated-binding protein 2 n=1 Tax=Bacillus rossius redtenbacheri TaxID=93214 RepID=UPI002FDE11A0
MSNNSLEIVHAGWLTKSPPSKPIWRARWRKRWFVLRHSGELPGQYCLEYYTDHNCRKLKGKIDLDQCEQVDAGLRFENNKQKYQHMFDVKTPKRIYYLAAESEDDMNKWVEYVCHVCGLKAYKEDEDNGAENGEAEAPAPREDSPPTSPASSVSGPYIPISECISGMPLSSPGGLSDFNKHVANGTGPPAARPEFYDAPRKLLPPAAPSPSPVPAVNWDTFPAGCEDLGSWSVMRRFGRLTIVDSAAPPRPPKPQRPGSEPPSPSPGAADGTYDCPRSHPAPHCYSNAAPGAGRVFCYEFADGEPPPSPLSETSSAGGAVYSNLPSPHAPAVDRGLKPGRRTSDSASVTSEPSPSPVPGPPSVDRKLKPLRRLGHASVAPDPIQLCRPPEGPRSLRRHRAAPSPTPLGRHSSSDDCSNDDNMYLNPVYGNTFQGGVQYLDLDLGGAERSPTASAHSPRTPTPAATVYKTVDFVKTEAFKRTKREVEEGRKQCAAAEL